MSLSEEKGFIMILMFDLYTGRATKVYEGRRRPLAKKRKIHLVNQLARLPSIAKAYV